MRELHGYHGEHRRHAHDATAPADTHGKHAPDRAHETPKHASHDSPKFKILRDPEARKAEHLKYQQKVEAAEAEYAAKHAKPKPGDQPRTPEQRKPQEQKPEHAPPETRDKPASRISERTKSPERQEQKQSKPERSRLPANDTTQMLAGIGITLSSVADAVNVLPGRWDAVLASFLGAAVASVAWANRRWKDKHGNRPED